MTDSAWFSKRIDCPTVLLNRSVIHWCIYRMVGDRRSALVRSLAHDASVSLLLSGQISMRVMRLHSENLGVESRWGQHLGGWGPPVGIADSEALLVQRRVSLERLNNRCVPRDSKSAIDIGTFARSRTPRPRPITDNGRHPDRCARMRWLLALDQEGKQKVP